MRLNESTSVTVWVKEFGIYAYNIFGFHSDVRPPVLWLSACADDEISNSVDCPLVISSLREEDEIL